MWSDIVRSFLTVVLSVAFLVLFGEKNFKRYREGGITKIRNEEDRHQNDIQIPGLGLFLKTKYNVHRVLYIIVISIADTSNLVAADNKKFKVCKGYLDIASCIENDKSKIIDTDSSNQSYYADFWRKVGCYDCKNSGLVNKTKYFKFPNRTTN